MDSNASVPRRLLMVAFHFPPVHGASGVHRTLAFARHLPEHHWEPLLLTPHPRAYPHAHPPAPGEMPPGLAVHPAFALDAKRHLAIAGRYARLTALPDRYAAWWLGAVPKGLALIRRYRPRAIWSTYPMATTHLIALTLHRLTGLPWIADFRDPMVLEFYPETPAERWAHQTIEGAVVRHCARVVVVTRGMGERLRQRYPELPAERVVVIPNGIGEGLMEKGVPEAPGPVTGRPVRLVHGGHLYLQEGQRDPRPLLAALALLQQRGDVGTGELRVVLRGSGYDRELTALIREHGVEGLVEVAPMLPQREALAEMGAADALLLIQGGLFNDQIPAKLYEYLAMRRPILALTPEGGETGRLLREAGCGIRVDPDGVGAIAAGVGRLLAECRGGRGAVAAGEVLTALSRRGGAARLAGLLNGVTGMMAAGGGA